jgi:hypothetical protein
VPLAAAVPATPAVSAAERASPVRRFRGFMVDVLLGVVRDDPTLSGTCEGDVMT